MKILLLNMPFVSLSRPSIGISILKARLAEEGVACDIGYANLYFSELFGIDKYNLVDEKVSDAIFCGDWLFAQWLFGDRLDTDEYLRVLQRFVQNGENYQKVLALRSGIGPFLSACMGRYRITEYDLIGFTTTFGQNLASLAFSFLIKQEHPDKLIVFGGGNCEGVMGWEIHRSFPWVDYVCSGESEQSFPALLESIRLGESPASVRGVVYRDGECTLATAAAEPIRDMDRVPVPDYDDYFLALEEHSLSAELSPSILIETSRGCWWGAKSHCTFCGLNGNSMAFRSKSADRVIDELRFLKGRYGISRFVAVDNIIDMKHVRDVLPRLKVDPLGISLFYETKSNLTREQVRLFVESGIRAIQPGIESLNSHVLELMRKGVTALQNIQFLKWCKEDGVALAWNLLYGFPGETPEDYEETSRMIDALYHLPPPHTTATIRMDRFSPYFNDPEGFGLTCVRPFFSYALIYPVTPEQISNLAYFFEFNYTDGRNPASYLGEVLQKIERWKNAEGCSLDKVYGQDPELLITDTRPGHIHSRVALNGLQRAIYDYCDQRRTLRSILSYVGSHGVLTTDLEGDIERFLEELVAWRLMVKEKQHYLSVALPA